jgi:hypothetical protein
VLSGTISPTGGVASCTRLVRLRTHWQANWFLNLTEEGVETWHPKANERQA